MFIIANIRTAKVTLAIVTPYLSFATRSPCAQSHQANGVYSQAQRAALCRTLAHSAESSSPSCHHVMHHVCSMCLIMSVDTCAPCDYVLRHAKAQCLGASRAGWHSMDYGFTHNDTVYTPNGSSVALADNQARNKGIEAAELAEWAHGPESFGAYVTGCMMVTTWLGTKLGDIAYTNAYRDGFGHNMRSIRVRGTNGAMYHGRYGADWSQYVRLRRMSGRA